MLYLHVKAQQLQPSALSLFMLRVLADDSDDALSLNDLALFAHRLNR